VLKKRREDGSEELRGNGEEKVCGVGPWGGRNARGAATAVLLTTQAVYRRCPAFHTSTGVR
jgi:hypothetical protein